jgi:tripartite-type tricarboxylate transporter receptor subunit TctC
MGFRALTTAILSASVVGLVSAAMPMAGASAEDFFKDKTVTVVVPSGSGGTFHIYCQLVQRNMGPHIPGNPKMIIQNRPGAGGVKSLRWMVSAAPKDGTVIAMINPGTTMTPILRPKMGYDARELQWLGAPSVRTYTLGVWHTTPVKTIDDAKKMEVTLSSTGRAATSTLLPQLMNKLIGTKFKVIHGYKGGGAMNLAVERGEVMGRTNYYSGYTGARPHWLREGKITFLATFGPPRPEVKNVPRFIDMVKPGIDREMVLILESNFNVGQGFYVPPGVPKKTVNLLRKSFGAMVKDPAFKAEAKRRHVPTFSRTWQQVEEAVRVGYGSRKEAAEKLATLLGFRKKK